ncbi:hypothetical protein N2601_12750 [Rhizobium sp. CB3060]|uniref:hypothetical protein n=1 Tax=Rhizobium sp. CB3060 TaxID=3138255 RepID=UPI0021A8BDC2|nr:hypothetical protein [Rhizobium tropici]UWU20163.1 hypothetical protein N2601_12750 [Rhizobium tropici]
MQSSPRRRTTAVEQQDQTINQLKADANRLQEATTAYSDAVKKTEADFVVEWEAIDAIDFSTPKNTDELERQSNDEFAKSVDSLRAATSPGN